jgi:PAS domain S-box-containing protein
MRNRSKLYSVFHVTITLALCVIGIVVFLVSRDNAQFSQRNALVNKTQYPLSSQLQERLRNDETRVANLETGLYAIIGVALFLCAVAYYQSKKQLRMENRYEENLDRLIEAAPDAMIIVDEKGLIRKVNDPAQELFGYKRAEMINQTVEFLLPKSFRSGHAAARERFGAAGKQRLIAGEQVFTSLKKDGTTFLSEISLMPIRTREGKCITAMVRDVSQRIKTSERLASLSQQVNQAMDAILVVDTDLVIKSWNRGAENLYGFSANEAIGHKSNELLRTAITNDEIVTLTRLINENGYWLGELGRKTKAGRNLVVITSITALRDQAGTITGYISVGHDITGQKKLQEQVNYLARIVEQSSEAIISRGLDLRLISWNKGAEKLMGYTRGEALGKTANELGIIRFSREEIAEIENGVNTHGIWNGVKQYYRKDGTSFTGEVIANSVRNDKHEITALSFVIKDISLKKHLEGRLKKMNEELEEKVKARTEEIRLAEEKYRHIFENSPMPMWVIDPEDYRFLAVNEMAVHKYGYSREEFLSMSALQIRPEDERQQFIELDRPLEVRGANSYRGVWRHRKKDGSLIRVEIIAHDINYEGRRARLILSNDVTEKIKAEENLVASEKRYREALDNMLEGVQIIGFDWTYLYVNNAAAGQGKRSREDLIGNKLTELYPGVEGSMLYGAIRQCLTERRPLMLQNEFKFPDQSVGWFDLSIQPIPEGVFILSVDITERVQSTRALQDEKEKLSAIANVSPGLIYSFLRKPGGEFAFAYASHSVIDILGYSLEDLKDGVNPVIDAAVDEDRELLFASIEKSAQDLSPWHLEFRYLHPVTGLTWLEGHSIPTRLPDGSTLWHGILMDVTDRKIAEQRLQNLNAELELLVAARTQQLNKSNEDLEAFTYSVSHDLRAPLRGIIGFTSILEEEYANRLDEEAKRLTGIIKNNTLKMGTLIDDLLSFARLGRHEIDKISFDTNEMVKGIIENLDKNHDGPKISWRVGNLSHSYGDVTTIRQVWINLLSNAVKYSSLAPAPIIEVGSYEWEGDIVFFVRDNGVGFDPKYYNKLFKVFQRLHGSNEFEGTGVGLAIVEKIVSRHGGKAWAESEKGKGACFYFSLPQRETRLSISSNHKSWNTIQ